MPLNDFVVCASCGRSATWMGQFSTCPWCGAPLGENSMWNPFLTFDLSKISFGTTEQKVRKYLPTLAELIDRLTIAQQKELKLPEKRDEYTQEVNDLVHDIQLCLEEQTSFLSATNAQLVTADMIRDIIVLAIMNCTIWQNESNFRKGIKDGNNLELTHGLNGIRNTAKNKIQEKFGGRKDYKIDNVKAFSQWVPSGYSQQDALMDAIKTTEPDKEDK